MLSSRRLLGDDSGFSLVELLVVILLLGVVGTVMVSGTVRGYRASGQAESRIEAFNEMQIAVERASRELRAADPVLAAGPNQATVRTFRDGGCSEFTYDVDPAGTLGVTQRNSTDDCTTLSAGTRRVLVRDVDAGAGDAFTYRDANGNTVTDPGQVATITLTLVRTLPTQPSVTVSTLVNVRNAQ